MSEFLDMGGYGAYVWPSYLVTLIILGGLCVASWSGMRRQEAELKSLQDDSPRRRRNRGGA
ncbi:MAG: heme exporter protein CcmD [Rhodospirillales bacterium]